MRRAFALLAAVLTLASTAPASERSERLYSQGLVELHAGRYAEALRLFDDAVRDDPSDAYALYYRGVTHGHMKSYTAAAEDLRAALEREPALERAALELGAVLLESGDAEAAIPWLEKAQDKPGSDLEASLFLGIAQVRLGRTDAGQANLSRAAGGDAALEVAARYYRGVADYRDGRWSEAQSHFAYVAARKPGTDLAREAKAFLAKMSQKTREESVAPPYNLYGSAGFEYDSNVALAPSDDVVALGRSAGDVDDGRIVLEVGGSYSPWRGEHTELSLGYELYQSLHFDLDRFDLQNHRPSIRFTAHTGPLQVGIEGRYDYYLLDSDSFLQEGMVLPWLGVAEGTIGRTEVFYRMRRRDFLKRPFDGVLDAFNHAVGVRQLLYLGDPEHYLSLGYRFDREDPIHGDGDRFGYDGHEISIGLAWTLGARFSVETAYAYRYEDYFQQSLGRLDDEHRLLFALHQELTDHVRLTGAYFGTINDSNRRAFDYDRHIGSIALEVRL